jgi:limonene-1,2-epoxide hydrolase
MRGKTTNVEVPGRQRTEKTQGATVMTDDTGTSEPESTVRAFFASWDTIGFEASYRQYFTDEVVLWVPGREMRGLDAVLTGLAGYLAAFRRPFATVEVLALAVAGDKVLAERIETNRNPDNGDSFTQPMMSSMTVVDGRISHWADYYDREPYRPGGEAYPGDTPAQRVAS